MVFYRFSIGFGRVSVGFDRFHRDSAHHGVAPPWQPQQRHSEGRQPGGRQQPHDDDDDDDDSDDGGDEDDKDNC